MYSVRACRLRWSKTHRSARPLPLSALAVRALEAQRVRQAKERLVAGRCGQIMELLGHSTIRMTADTYGHVLPARARKAASAIDRILGQEGTA
ncbi:hypothetical protein [Micromonospora sp. A202]|uniref:hypothetical protein n=1 Tax=Micromonospora sp. A202 TaxID=2572899 RepID=UPI002104C967|nr:hypothetical protein [Micromonospora sp. A202]